MWECRSRAHNQAIRPIEVVSQNRFLEMADSPNAKAQILSLYGSRSNATFSALSGLESSILCLSFLTFLSIFSIILISCLLFPLYSHVSFFCVSNLATYLSSRSGVFISSICSSYSPLFIQRPIMFETCNTLCCSLYSFPI